MLHIKKRVYIRLISFFAAALLTLGGFTARALAEAEHQKYLLEVRYRHAFAEFVNSVGDIDNSLQKSLYAATPPMVVSACADVYGKTTAALTALGNLPFSDYQLENLAAFITKTGDYSFTLAKNSCAESIYSDEQRETLRLLCEISAQLHGNLRGVERELSDGVISVRELRETNRKLDEVGGTAPTSLGESFAAIESEFPEVPALVYDGPFSQSVLTCVPKWIDGAAEVSENEAMEIAREFTGLRNLQSEGRREGNLPAWYFTAGDAAVTVSVQGGKILQLRDPRSVRETLLSADDAIAAGKTFLEDRGYPSMRESYYIKADNTLLINYAFAQDGVICYPDLIKLTVALDDGSIIGFEGVGYVMNHTDSRELPAISVDETSAASKLSKDLRVLSHGPAIIPSYGGQERFVHEFKCENSAGRHYIVCVNAETGHEEKILILLEDENGTLAI
ncbi:MAG: germination protein YpeB [Oscillospiraceae bacterium]|jgi:germination protein YpeB|nr:germination protein YpeB [Oscillospiraceae bacterium]